MAGLSPFQPAGVTSRLRRTELQYEALLADSAWDEAIDLLEQFQSASSDELVETSSIAAENPGFADFKAHTRYLPVRLRIQQLLASLPADGLDAYRQRIEGTARRQVDEATTQLDDEALRKVADRYAASQTIGDACLALSELALERGDMASARHWLSRLDPLASDPYRRPAALTLALLDPNADPKLVAEAWLSANRPSDSSGLPDSRSEATEITPTVLTRLALVSLREGDLARAEAEVKLLQGIAPAATGRLAGRDQPLVEALEAMLSNKRASASLDAGNEYGDFTWAWPPVELTQSPAAVAANQRAGVVQINGNFFAQPRQLFRPNAISSPQASDTAPRVRPVIVDDKAFYVERDALKQLDLITGKVVELAIPGLRSTPKATQPQQPAIGDMAARRFVIGANGRRIQFGQPAVIRQAQQPPTSITRVWPNLATAGDWLFIRTTKSTRQVVNRRQLPTTEDTLLAIDPNKPSEVALRLTPGEESDNDSTDYQFSGPPLVRGDRLYVALTRPGTRTDVAVACYSIHSARQLWRTDLGAGEPVNRLIGNPWMPFTLSGDSLYLSTDLGATAALNARNGEVHWLTKYPRASTKLAISRPRTAAQPSNPCVVVGDRLIAAPADSDKLIAWEASTGRPLWEVPRARDATIAGLASDRGRAVVVLGGRQVAAYDSLTGSQRFAWPESGRAGLRGIGSPTVAGDEVFWPTRDALYTLDAGTAGQTRSPIDLRLLSVAGANAIRTDLGLLLVGTERIGLLAASQETASAEPEPRLSRLIRD